MRLLHLRLVARYGSSIVMQALSKSACLQRVAGMDDFDTNEPMLYHWGGDILHTHPLGHRLRFQSTLETMCMRNLSSCLANALTE